MMSPALIGRFAPLFALAGKPVKDFSKEQLGQVATALAGPNAASLLPVLERIQVRHPDASPMEVLGTDTAKELFSKMDAKTRAVSETTICTCPFCSMNFEVQLV